MRFGRRKDKEYRPPPISGVNTSSSGGLSNILCEVVTVVDLDTIIGANLVKRPSIRDRAKQWASDVKTSATAVGVPLRRTRTRDGPSSSVSSITQYSHISCSPLMHPMTHQRVEVVSTPLDAIKNPFAPHGHDLPQTPPAEPEAGHEPSEPPIEIKEEPSSPRPPPHTEGGDIPSDAEPESPKSRSRSPRTARHGSLSRKPAPTLPVE